jgi:hypothetical protein
MEESKGLGGTIKKMIESLKIESPNAEHIARVNELLSQDPIKSNCKELNRLGVILGGHSINSCFCTTSERTAFRRDFQNWWNSPGRINNIK